MLDNKTAVYPGSFDPITNGHLDIINRISGIFNRVIVAVTQNPQKNTLFTFEERTALIKESCANIPHVEVISFTGLLVDFVKTNNAKVIVRGMRAVTDFEYEYAMALMNKNLGKEVETVFLTASEGNTFVSSSIIKEVFKLGGDVSNKIPACVFKALQKKFPQS